LLDFE